MTHASRRAISRLLTNHVDDRMNENSDEQRADSDPASAWLGYKRAVQARVHQCLADSRDQTRDDGVYFYRAV